METKKRKSLRRESYSPSTSHRLTHLFFSPQIEEKSDETSVRWSRVRMDVRPKDHGKITTRIKDSKTTCLIVQKTEKSLTLTSMET